MATVKVELVGGPRDGSVIDWSGPLRPRIETRSRVEGGSGRIAEYVVWYGKNSAGHEVYLFRGYKES